MTATLDHKSHKLLSELKILPKKLFVFYLLKWKTTSSTITSKPTSYHGHIREGSL